MNRTSRRPSRVRSLGACTAHRVAILTAGLAIAGRSAPAVASELTFQVEPAVAFWVDDPQSDRFTPGFYGAIRPGVSLGRVVGFQWSYSLLVTPATPSFSETGTAHLLTAGVRFRPLGMVQPEATQLGGLWTDVNLGYVRTGALDRFGFDLGLGYGFQVAPSFALGPVVRYTQILQPDGLVGQSPDDGQLLTVGLNFSFGTVADDEPEVCPPAPEPAPECVETLKVVVLEPPPPCVDPDLDGVCADVDRCPTQAGPAATYGCTIDPCNGAPLDVLVQFAYDSAGLPALERSGPQTMDPVLEAVADAMEQDKTCRVCIVGYASEEGGEAYNLELSDRRASAVRGYMMARGLTRRRMPTSGMGESCPVIPESSLELNRRVEFRRLLAGESCPSDCAE